METRVSKQEKKKLLATVHFSLTTIIGIIKCCLLDKLCFILLQKTMPVTDFFIKFVSFLYYFVSVGFVFVVLVLVVQRLRHFRREEIFFTSDPKLFDCCLSHLLFCFILLFFLYRKCSKIAIVQFIRFVFNVEI